MLVNPDIEAWFEKLQGRQQGRGGSARGQGLPSAPLEGIVKPERGMFGFNAPQIEGRFQARSPAPYLQPSPMRGIPPVAPSSSGGGGRDLGGAAKAAGLQKLGAGIEQGIENFAAKRLQQQQQAALANAPGLPPLPPPGSRTPVHKENGAPEASEPPKPTFQPVAAASETPTFAQPGGGAGVTGSSIGPEGASLPTFAQGAPAPVMAGGSPVAQFLGGIKVGEGVPYSGQSRTGAIGAYGLTGDFIKHYAPGAGLPTDRASYTNNPGLQDQLATHAANEMYTKGDYPGGHFPNATGDWAQVSNGWLTGSPTATTSAPGNMSPHAYVAKVMGAANMAPAQAIAPTGAAAYAATPPTGVEPSFAEQQPRPVLPAKPFDPNDTKGSGVNGTPYDASGKYVGYDSSADIVAPGPQSMNDQANPLAAALAGGAGDAGQAAPLDQSALLAMALSQNQPDFGGFFG